MRPCTIIGNVGGTPEMRYTPNGKAVTDFSLALYGGKTQAGDKITTWVRVTTWADLARIVASKVSKGDKVQCAGCLLPVELWEKREGGMAYSIKMTAFSVHALEYNPVDLERGNTDQRADDGSLVGKGAETEPRRLAPFDEEK